MLRLAVADCGEGCVASFTVTAIVLDPLCVGVPEIAPEEPSIESPAGSPVALNAYGVVPPEAATTLLYAMPTVPPGSDVVVIVSLVGAAGATVTLSLADADCGEGCVESVTVTVKDVVPAVPCAGKPAMMPVWFPIESPLGKPEALNAYGVLPPDTAIEAL
jgi:hypothetical protein